VLVVNNEVIPIRKNMLLGPSDSVLDEYGAVNTYKIMREREWWRLFSGMVLHAGVIQMTVNITVHILLSWAINDKCSARGWIGVYIVCGIYTNILSCAVSYKHITVGSTGATSGVLSAFIVWTLFRWYKIPPDKYRARTQQLMAVFLAYVLLFILSVSPTVNWAGSLGGMIMGVCTSGIFLSEEFVDIYARNGLRVLGCASLSLVVGCTVFYLTLWVKPNPINT